MLTDAARSKLTEAGLNLIQQALSIYDSELRLVVSNRRFREMFDLPERFVTPGSNFGDLIRYLVERGEYDMLDDPEAAIRFRVAQARTFQPHYLERQRPDGRWISVEGSPLTQGGWVAVYTDITAIKRQEALLRARSEELSADLIDHAERLSETNRALAATNAALAEAQRELTEMEARTRLTTEMMPAHIAHVGRDLRYTYSNRRLSSVMPGRPSNILGLSGREALGETAFARIEPSLRAALAGEASVLEFTDDDSGRRIRAAFTPDRAGPPEAGGPINGVYILSMDVTEESQARASLMQARKRELAAQLTSGLAHDFANLLTIILGLQSRIERLPGLPRAARELTAATTAAARRGGTLLDRIAQMSGRREMRPAATDLRVFLADLRTLAAPSLPEGVALDLEARSLTRPLLIDPGSLQDSLLNLILNARDAIGAGPGAIRIEAVAVRDTWLEITVSDTGPGFSEVALERALDPFFTTKGGEGSGLGLSMVYDLTTLAGGRVLLANTAHGAEVTLRLPLRFASETPSPGLVLLVEDSPEIRQSVREMLIELGHSVIEAASADEAERLADIPGIDLVLSDITLAGGRAGLDLVPAFAARGIGEVRLMSSLPPGDALRDRAAARAPVLAKPFARAELAAFLAGAGEVAADGPATPDRGARGVGETGKEGVG
jgi:signal transduction histidine kinase